MYAFKIVYDVVNVKGGNFTKCTERSNHYPYSSGVGICKGIADSIELIFGRSKKSIGKKLADFENGSDPSTSMFGTIFTIYLRLAMNAPIPTIHK